MSHRLNLRLLEVFRAVMSANGVTEAAATLNISQPAVSKAIAQLEAELNMQLFGRKHGRLYPTSDAHQLYLESGRLFVQVATFRERLSKLTSATSGKLVIYAIPTLAASIVVQATSRFQKARPAVKIEITATTAAKVAEAVGQHKADIGLVHSPVADRTVTGEIIGESEIVAVMNERHPLAKQKVLTPKDLYLEPLILNDPGSPPTHLVYETFAAAGLTFQVALEANSSAVANAAARAGHGIALIDPWTGYPGHMSGFALCQFKPRIPLRITILHSMFRPPSKAAELFQAEVKSALRQAAKENRFISV